MMKKDTIKRQGSTDPCALIKAGNFINVIFFWLYLIDKDLLHRKYTFYGPKIQLIGMFVSLLSFTLPDEIFCTCFLPVLLT